MYYNLQEWDYGAVPLYVAHSLYTQQIDTRLGPPGSSRLSNATASIAAETAGGRIEWGTQLPLCTRNRCSGPPLKTPSVSGRARRF
jgi:hypothetical protein